MAIALMSKAGTVPDPGRAVSLLEQARSHLDGLWEENRSSYLEVWNLAKLHRRWSLLAADPAARESHRLEAERYYRTTHDLFPGHPRILDDWAAFALEQQDFGRALQLLDQSLAIDGNSSGAHVLRGAVHMRRNAYAPAAADYERALALDPKSVEAKEGLEAARRALAGGQGP